MCFELSLSEARVFMLFFVANLPEIGRTGICCVLRVRHIAGPFIHNASRVHHGLALKPVSTNFLDFRSVQTASTYMMNIMLRISRPQRVPKAVHHDTYNGLDRLQDHLCNGSILIKFNAFGFGYLELRLGALK